MVTVSNQTKVLEVDISAQNKRREELIRSIQIADLELAAINEKHGDKLIEWELAIQRKGAESVFDSGHFSVLLAANSITLQQLFEHIDRHSTDGLIASVGASDLPQITTEMVQELKRLIERLECSQSQVTKFLKERVKEINLSTFNNTQFLKSLLAKITANGLETNLPDSFKGIHTNLKTKGLTEAEADCALIMLFNSLGRHYNCCPKETKRKLIDAINTKIDSLERDFDDDFEEDKNSRVQVNKECFFKPPMSSHKKPKTASVAQSSVSKQPAEDVQQSSSKKRNHWAEHSNSKSLFVKEQSAKKCPQCCGGFGWHHKSLDTSTAKVDDSKCTACGFVWTKNIPKPPVEEPSRNETQSEEELPEEQHQVVCDRHEANTKGTQSVDIVHSTAKKSVAPSLKQSAMNRSYYCPSCSDHNVCQKGSFDAVYQGLMEEAFADLADAPCSEHCSLARGPKTLKSAGTLEEAIEYSNQENDVICALIAEEDANAHKKLEFESLAEPCLADVELSASKLVHKVTDKAILSTMTPQQRQIKQVSKKHKLIAKMAVNGMIARTSKLMTSYYSGVSAFSQTGFSRSCLDEPESEEVEADPQTKRVSIAGQVSEARILQSIIEEEMPHKAPSEVQRSRKKSLFSEHKNGKLLCPEAINSDQPSPDQLPATSPDRNQTSRHSDSCDYELRTNLCDSQVRTDGQLTIKIVSASADGLSLQDCQLHAIVEEVEPQSQPLDAVSFSPFRFHITRQRAVTLRVMEGQKTLASRNYPLENIIITERVLISEKLDFLVHSKELQVRFEFEWQELRRDQEEEYQPPRF